MFHNKKVHEIISKLHEIKIYIKLFKEKLEILLINKRLFFHLQNALYLYSLIHKNK